SYLVGAGPRTEGPRPLCDFPQVFGASADARADGEEHGPGIWRACATGESQRARPIPHRYGSPVRLQGTALCAPDAAGWRTPDLARDRAQAGRRDNAEAVASAAALGHPGVPIRGGTLRDRRI